MKEKIFKKGIKRRLFSVVLALAMVIGLVPLNSSTVYADAEWKTYAKDGVTIWYDSSIVDYDIVEGVFALFDCDAHIPTGAFHWTVDSGWDAQYPCDHIRTTNPHTHGSWAYTASGATLTAKCNETTAICDLQDQKVSLTLNVRSANHSGNPVAATLDGTAAWSDASLDIPTVKYVGRGGTEYQETDIPPKEVGKYTAKISPDNTVFATKDFEITDSGSNGVTKKIWKGEQTGLTFTAPQDFDVFLGGGKVFVDNKEVDKAHYDARSGSTIITLKPTFLATLSQGAHTFRIAFVNGTNYDAEFIVDTAAPASASAAAASPKTGDSSNAGWVFIMVAALFMLLGFSTKKRYDF